MSCYICGGKDNGIVLDYNQSDKKICKLCNGHKNVLQKTKGTFTYDTANSVEYFSNILKRRTFDSELSEILCQWNSEIKRYSESQTVAQGDELPQEKNGMGMNDMEIPHNETANNKEMEYLLREQLSTLKSIKSMLSFFVVLTVIGLILGIIAVM